VAIDVKSLGIVFYPAPVLRQRAAEIDLSRGVSDDVRAVAARMIEVMREEEGIGLAAPQIGLSWRMFVVDVPKNEERVERGAGLSPGVMLYTDGPVVYINPKVTPATGEITPYDEGCLSLPKITGHVRRPDAATVTAYGLDGEQFTHSAAGLLARCFQHENDHLDGVLIIDKMSEIARLKNRAALRELEKRAGVR
jgi:peptide deformylase